MAELTRDTDSSKNILDILNDDCIDEILRRVDILMDLLSLAEVCKRLRKCAMQQYRIRYETMLTITTPIIATIFSMPDRSRFRQVQIAKWDHCRFPDFVHLNRSVTFLRIFGSMTKNILFQSTNSQIDDTIFRSIVEYCGRTLKALSLTTYDANFEQTPFELEHLCLCQSTPKNLSTNSLKTLYITGFTNPSDEHEVWFMQKLPELKRFIIDGRVTDDMASEFLSLNPQLEVLVILSLKLTVAIFKSISNCLNLTRLQLLDLSQSTPPDVFEANLRLLSSLKKLKGLTISVGQYESIANLFDLFVENGIPMENLTIALFSSPDAHANSDPLYRNLRTINTLKNFSFVVKGFVSNSGEMFEKIVRTQPSLEKLRIDGAYSGKGVDLSMTNLATILKYALNFKKLKFYINKLEGNEKDYERALFYAKKNRVPVSISVKRGKYTVPLEVLMENRKWIEVILTR